MHRPALLLACLTAVSIPGCRSEGKTEATPSPAASDPTAQMAPPRPTKTAADYPNLKVETITPGTGAAIEYGQTGRFHYTGTLVNGTEFDSSRKRGEPVEFALQSGSLIEGWILALPGMKVGERRRLVIPPELGYGASGSGSIPPNSILVFDVELVEIVKR